MKGSTNILQSNIRELQNPEFTEASTRSNITSGESIFAIFGKIKKWFSDLASMFVSKSGDTMTGALTVQRSGHDTPLILHRTDAVSAVYAEFRNSDGTLGYFGVNRGKKPVFFDTQDHALAYASDIPTDFVSKANGGAFGGDIEVNQNNGTTSTVGETRLYLGNATPEGTDRNSYGSLFIYSNTQYVTRLRAATGQTKHRNIYLPDKAGTIALTSDVEDVSSQVDNIETNLSTHTVLTNSASNVTLGTYTFGVAPVTLTKGLWIIEGVVQGIDAITNNAVRNEIFFSRQQVALDMGLGR